jgi:hypothetical protein
MSCAVVALYIIRIGLFLAFFSFFLAFQRKKNRRLCPWQSLVDANVLVHFFSFSPCSPRLSHILICYCRFFLYSRLLSSLRSQSKNVRKRKEEKKMICGFSSSACMLCSNKFTPVHHVRARFDVFF